MNPAATMQRKWRALLPSYQAALRRYLKPGSAADARPALRLGRRAVALGLETLDLALIHEQALRGSWVSVSSVITYLISGSVGDGAGDHLRRAVWHTADHLKNLSGYGAGDIGVAPIAGRSFRVALEWIVRRVFDDRDSVPAVRHSQRVLAGIRAVTLGGPRRTAVVRSPNGRPAEELCGCVGAVDRS